MASFTTHTELTSVDETGLVSNQEPASVGITRPMDRSNEEAGLYSCSPEFGEVELYHFLSSSGFKKMYPLEKANGESDVSQKKTEDQKNKNSDETEEDNQDSPSSFSKEDYRAKELSGLYSSSPEFTEVELYHFLSSSAFKKMYPLEKTNEESDIFLRKTEGQTTKNNNGWEEDNLSDSSLSPKLMRKAENRAKEESGYSSGPEFEEVELYHFLSSSSFKKMYPLEKSATKTKNKHKTEEDGQDSPISIPEPYKGDSQESKGGTDSVEMTKEASCLSSSPEFEDEELYYFLSSSSFKKMYRFDVHL